eukprot:760290-Hanusia_phi.AAC.2
MGTRKLTSWPKTFLHLRIFFFSCGGRAGVRQGYSRQKSSTIAARQAEVKKNDQQGARTCGMPNTDLHEVCEEFGRLARKIGRLDIQSGTAGGKNSRREYEMKRVRSEMW